MANAITDSDFIEKVEKTTGLVMVDFWAPWCSPCLILGPSVERISEEMQGKVSVYKLNVDENRETAGKFRVMSIPTVMWFKDGKVVDSVLGAVPYDVLHNKCKELIAE